MQWGGALFPEGENEDGGRAECWLLAGGRWWPRAPMSGPRYDACSAVIDNELWVCGGVGGGQRAYGGGSRRGSTRKGRRRVGAGGSKKRNIPTQTHAHRDAAHTLERRARL